MLFPSHQSMIVKNSNRLCRGFHNIMEIRCNFAYSNFPINLINPIPKRYCPTNGLPIPSNALPFLLQLL